MTDHGPLVEIVCNVVSDNPGRKAVAVTDGTREAVPGGDAGRTREKWCWIPRSLIAECVPPLDALPYRGPRLVTLTMPVWLAIQEGLV